MTLRTSSLTLAATCLIATAGGLAAPDARAQEANAEFSGILHRSHAAGVRELQSAGFYRHSTSGNSANLYENFWSSARHECLSVRSVNGNIASVVDAPPLDCGQDAKAGDDKHNNAAAIAVGAAALLGIAALAHKQHHHDDENHTSSQQAEADFERGYRDGLYNQTYHRDAGSDYAKGYSAGVSDRQHETRYRTSSASARNHVEVDDLVGARAAGADATLRSRGFTDKKHNQQGNYSVVYWWNAGTRQCINVSTTEGRIESIAPIDASNCR